MMKGTHVSWLALVGALAVAPLGTVAFGADSTTTPPPATDTTTAPAAPAATETPAPAEKKGDDVTVIQVDPSGPAKAEGTLGQLVPGQMTAEDIIGKSVVNGQGETIGEVNDIVLDKDKAVYAVLSVGGFLGIGTTYVAVPFDKIQITTADGASKVQIVASVTEDDLKNLAAAQKGEETTSEAGRSKPADADMTAAAPAETAPADTTTTTTTTTTATDNTAAPATTESATTDNAGAAAPATTETTTTETAKTDTATTTESTTAPAAGSADQTQVAAAYANVTAEDLIGKKVVNAAGENIGEIEDLVIDNQKVVMAVVSVGGFLGIGEKYVAVPLEQLKLSEDKATLASGLTKEDLEKMPGYEKGKLQGVEKGKPIYGSS